MKNKNRLIRGYAGKLIKVYKDGMETTLNVVEVPLLSDLEEADEDLENIDIEKKLMFQCNCCRRSIEILLDDDENIIGARCPECSKHDIKAS